MSDMIDEMENEKRKSAKEAQDEDEIYSQRKEIFRELVQKILPRIQEADNKIFNDEKKFWIQPDRFSSLEDNTSIFCVLIDEPPKARLYIHFNAKNIALKRTLVTWEDPNKSGIKQSLPEIEIKLDENENHYFQCEGKTIEGDELTDLFISPALQAHREG